MRERLLCVVRLFVGRVAGDRIVFQAQPQSHRRPDGEGNFGRADCEEAGVSNMRREPEHITDNPFKEFGYRRQIALKCGYDDVTGRLIAFVEWMRDVPLIARTITKLRKEARPEQLLFHGSSAYRWANRHIDARTIEQKIGRAHV